MTLGSASVPLKEIIYALFSPDKEEYRRTLLIILQIRLPRIILTLLVGGSLSAAGVAVQGLFRNPMASPDILGISAGGSLGALIAIYTGLSALNLFILPAFAVVTATGTGLLIYFLSSSKRGTSLLFLILAGMGISSLINSVISAILLFSQEYQISQYLFWTMGGFENRQWKHVLLLLPFLIPSLSYLFASTGHLNILLYGEDTAHSLGMNVERKKKGIIFTSALITGACVSVSGTIGFIGLIIPHLCRFFTGPDNKKLLPVSVLTGALFLLLCDTIARSAFSPIEIKTGIITSLIGAPYFIHLILKYQKKGFYGIFETSGRN